MGAGVFPFTSNFVQVKEQSPKLRKKPVNDGGVYGPAVLTECCRLVLSDAQQLPYQEVIQLPRTLTSATIREW